MTTLSIRNLDEQLQQQLQLEASKHGWSVEEEVQQILRKHLLPAVQVGFGTRLQQRFADLDGVELNIPPRHIARHVGFDGDVE